MHSEEKQSAYKYSTRKTRDYYEDHMEPIEETSDEMLSKTESVKSIIDPFLGTVTGRLAQEIHDEFLVCKICFESYDNPKCLSCLHTFCAKCIDKHISAEVTYNKYTDYRDFTCPLCRKRTQLPLGGVKRLPDNFLIMGLTEMVMRQRAASYSSSSMTLTPIMNSRGACDGIDSRSTPSAIDEASDQLQQLPKVRNQFGSFGECEICSQVGQGERGRSTEPTFKNGQEESTHHRASSAHLDSAPQASAKCLDCNKLLCEACVKRHRTTKVTKDHATFDLQSRKYIECKDHPGESVRFYCEACSACICVLCTFNEHREHEVTSFGEAVSALRSQLTSTLDEASQQIENCHLCLQAMSEVGDMVHNLERQIQQTADQFIEVIEKQKEMMLSDLHEFIGHGNIRNIERQLESEQQLELAHAICKEANELIEGQEFDMLLAKPEILGKMNQLTKLNLIETGPDPIPSEVFFRPGNVQLGFLTNDLSEPPTEQYDYLQLPLSSSQSSIELANRPCVNTSGTQTDIELLDSIIQKPTTTETKQFRARACNTEPLPVSDKDTNTRPRGIKTVISFTESPSSATSEEFLAQFDNKQIDLDAMDNLTRARIRRKLKERCNTFDLPSGSINNLVKSSKNSITNGSTDYITRRYSAFDKHHR